MIIIRLAAVFGALSLVCLFITARGSLSFWIALVSLLINVIVIACCIIVGRIKDKKDKDNQDNKD